MTKILDELDNSQAAEMLAFAGRSPQKQTRRNALIAWGVLARAPRDVDGINNSALKGLVDAAIHPLSSGDDQDEVLIQACDEIRELQDRRAQLHAFKLAAGRARSGSVEGGNAARMALLLASQGSMTNRLEAYRVMLVSRLLTIGRSLVECAGSVALSSLVLIALLWFALTITLSLTRAEADIGVSVWKLVVVGVVTAMFAAACAVPTRFLLSWRSRFIDVIAQSLLIGLVALGAYVVPLFLPSNDPLFLRSALRSSDEYYRFHFVILTIGIVTTRLVVMLSPVRHSLTKHTILTVIGAGGWGALAILVTCVALLHSPWESISNSAVSQWPLWVCAIGASAIGMAWVDSMRYTRVNELDRDKRGWMRTSAIYVGGAVGALVMATSLAFIMSRANQAADAWRRVAEAAPKAEGFDCADLTEGTRRKIETDLLYRVDRCPRNLVLNIDDKFPDDVTAYLLNAELTMLEFDQKPNLRLPMTPSPRRARAWNGRDVLYLCLSTLGERGCPARKKRKRQLPNLSLGWMEQAAGRIAGTHALIPMPPDTAHRPVAEPGKQIDVVFIHKAGESGF